MRVCVVGLGTTGLAQAHLLHKLGHEVLGYDIQPKTSPNIKLLKELQSDIDITFICTNENQVENVVKNLKEHNVQGLYVIKSTTPPETTEKLMRKYNVHICHNPEFLREKHSLEDVENPDRIIIGKCCWEHGELLTRLYQPMDKPIYITDPTTSELVKLAANAHLAMLITFWNEIHRLANALGVSTKTVAKLITADRRISDYGTRFFGRKYGGKCLPKDLAQLIDSYHQKNLNPKFLEAIVKFNES